MKKFLAIALIAASFTACSGDEKKTEETTTVTDSTTVAPAPATMDTAHTAPMDTAKTTTTTTATTTDSIKK